MQYNPQNFWEDRYRSHGKGDLRPSADLGAPDAVNQKTYSVKLDLLSKHLPLTKGTALDVGCGNGYITERLLRDGFKVSSCDFSRSAVDNTKGRFPQINAFVADITKDEPIGKFDAVVCLDVLYHIVIEDDWKRALEYIKNSCKPDGVILLGTHFSEETSIGFHIRQYSSKQLLESISPYRLIDSSPSYGEGVKSSAAFLKFTL